jgi:hypothetical protein
VRMDWAIRTMFAAVTAVIVLGAAIAVARPIDSADLPDCTVGVTSPGGRCATLSEPVQVSMSFRGALPVSLLRPPTLFGEAFAWRGGISRKTGLTMITMAATAPAALPIRRIRLDVSATLNEGLHVGTLVARRMVADATGVEIHSDHPVDIDMRTNPSPVRLSDVVFPAAVIERAVLFGSFRGRIGTFRTTFVSVSLPIGTGLSDPPPVALALPKRSPAPLMPETARPPQSFYIPGAGPGGLGGGGSPTPVPAAPALAMLPMALAGLGVLALGRRGRRVLNTQEG